MKRKLFIINYLWLLIISILISGLAFTFVPSRAQSTDTENVVVPSFLEFTEGNYENGYPFNLIWAGKQSMRYQQVYEADDFPFTDTPILITKIYFRPDAVHGVPFSATIPNIQINLSTTEKSPDHLSTVFANNVGSNDQVVYSGSLSISSEDIGPTGGPKDFDISIELEDPFLYDPRVGNLLLDVRSFSAAYTTAFDAHEEYGDSTSRVFTVVSDGVNQSSGLWHTGALVTQFTMVSVANQIPISDPNGPYLGAIGSQISFDGTGSFDPDFDTLTYEWRFGDNFTASSATPNHAFTVPGIYNVCLTVNDGYVDSEEVCTQAIVYDPSGGFVTGGGWFWSLKGAYQLESETVGWANFGFVAKYHKGADIPDGQVELVFHTAGMNFHSTSFDWLVVNGSDHAKFKGKGTINGEGNYNFIIWAGDGEPDTIRIKIWEEIGENEIVVYDNSLPNPAYENGQPVGKGNIIIHAKLK